MLGVRIECAQCHDHPFDAWTQQQFWDFAALFVSNVQQRQSASEALLKTARPKFLDGSSPKAQQYLPEVARWMTASDNPYVARTIVNRIWAQFFGIGLVDPGDDFSEQNPPSHPELLDGLAREMIAHEWDLKFLIRAIVTSQAYQRTSRVSHPSQYPRRSFASIMVRTLSADQIWDSYMQATGLEDVASRSGIAGVMGPGSARLEMRRLFSEERGAVSDRSTTIVQALALMNGRAVSMATDLQRGRTLHAITEFPGFDAAGKVEALCLATVSRPPTADENTRLTQYLDDNGPEAPSDILWALLNTSEFLTNH
jgi:hypothetical protein